MHKFIALTGFAIIAAGAVAQSFTESFDTVTFTTNGSTSATATTAGNFAGDTVNGDVTWIASNRSVPVGTTGWFNTGTASTPVFAAQGGAGMLNANFNNTSGASTIDNWLFSPVITLQNGDTISFWTRTTSSSSISLFPDRLILQLSTAGASTAAADFSPILFVNGGQTTTGYPLAWTQFSATISGLGAPVSGRFAFNYNVIDGGPEGNNSNFIGIDTVSYQAVPEPGTIAALGLGFLALARRRRAKK